MRVIISKTQSKNIRFDLYPNHVRACFYLGYSLTFIEELLNSRARESEADLLLQDAINLGMDDSYEVVIRENIKNHSAP